MNRLHGSFPHLEVVSMPIPAVCWTLALAASLLVLLPGPSRAQVCGTLGDTVIGAGETLLVEGCTVTIPLGVSVVVQDGGQLVNTGTILNRGNLELESGGSLVNNTTSALLRNERRLIVGGRLTNGGGRIENHYYMSIGTSGALVNNGGDVVHYGTDELVQDLVIVGIDDRLGSLSNNGGRVFILSALHIQGGIVDNRGGIFVVKDPIRIYLGGVLLNRDEPLFGPEAVLFNFGAEITDFTPDFPTPDGTIVNQQGAEIVNWGRVLAPVVNASFPPLGQGVFFQCPFAEAHLDEIESQIVDTPICAGVGDADGDGAFDVVDGDPSSARPDFVGALFFTDRGIGDPFTFGRIRDFRNLDLELEVNKTLTDDERNGIEVAAIEGSGSGVAVIDVCNPFAPLTGPADIYLTDGDCARITCGSVSVEVVEGPIEATFTADDGSVFHTSVPADHGLTFYPEVPSFEADAGNPTAIVIETGGLEFEVGAGETSMPPLLARVEIKPGSDPAPINLASWGLVPVAVFGSGRLDAADVDVTTLAFGPAAASPRSASLEDVDGDGIQDLVSHYATRKTGIDSTDDRACLTGLLLDGSAFGGCDAIRVVPSTACGLGLELVLLVPVVWWLQGRRPRTPVSVGGRRARRDPRPGRGVDPGSVT
jgi:hypothetical protein